MSKTVLPIPLSSPNLLVTDKQTIRVRLSRPIEERLKVDQIAGQSHQGLSKKKGKTQVLTVPQR